jgi:ribosomal protein S18 acetylase RimI-like enzyme
MDELGIRLLEEDDYDAVIDLWTRAGLSSLRLRGRDSRAAFSHQVGMHKAHKNGYMLCLEGGNHLIGIVIATHDGRKGWINRLAIDPDYQRQGHAQKLVRAAEQLLQKQGIKVIATLIEHDNTASLSLFQKMGYEANEKIRYLSKRETADA